jgi:hypothetical protein
LQKVTAHVILWASSLIWKDVDVDEKNVDEKNLHVLHVPPRCGRP